MQDEPTTQPSFPGATEPHQPQYEADPSAGYEAYQAPAIPPLPPVPPSRSRGGGHGFWGRRRNRWLVAVGAALALAIAIAGGAAFAAHQNTTSTAASQTTSANIPAPQKQNTIYTVVSVSGTTISATQGNGNSGASGSGSESVTITTSAKTKITRGGQLATLSDLTAGTKFRVRGKAQSDGQIAAERIEIVVPTVKGTIAAIDGGSLTIQTRKKAITVRLAPSTTIVDATTHASTTASGLTVGETVTIQGLPNGDGTYTALRILAGTPIQQPAKGTPTATGTPAE